MTPNIVLVGLIVLLYIVHTMSLTVLWRSERKQRMTLQREYHILLSERDQLSEYFGDMVLYGESDPNRAIPPYGISPVEVQFPEGPFLTTVDEMRMMTEQEWNDLAVRVGWRPR